MKLQDQVVSLEIARRLKELGVKQESLFWWVHHDSLELNPWVEYKPNKTRYRNYGKINRHVSAFTVAELGEMLPRYVKDTWELSVCKFMGKWEVRYEESVSSTEWLSELQNTLANAMGLMLIYLLENKLLTY